MTDKKSAPTDVTIAVLGWSEFKAVVQADSLGGAKAEAWDNIKMLSPDNKYHAAAYRAVYTAVSGSGFSLPAKKGPALTGEEIKALIEWCKPSEDTAGPDARKDSAKAVYAALEGCMDRARLAYAFYILDNPVDAIKSALLASEAPKA